VSNRSETSFFSTNKVHPSQATEALDLDPSILSTIPIPTLTRVTAYAKITVLFFSLLLSGGLLALAFAPHEFWPLAIVSPAYLLWVWQNPKLSPTPRRAFYLGSLFGLGMYGVGVSWVFVSIHLYGNTDIPLALFITALLVVGFALLMGLQGYTLKRFFKQSSMSLCLLGFPCLWVLFEWGKSIFLTGFPWLFLGNTQLNTALSGYAPIGSVYAVSLAVAISSGIFVALIYGSRSIKILATLLFMFIWSMGYVLNSQQWVQISNQEHTASLVQGNITPFDKFTQLDPIQSARDVYGRLSEKHWGSTLIIWPESAIAYPLPFVEPFLNELRHTAQVHNSTLITGLQTVINKTDYYNSMIALGKGAGLYHKQHLLPFGDFLPLDTMLRGLINFFNIPMSSFIEGPKNQSLLTAGTLKIAPLICYEIAFPELVRESVQEADVIVTLTEDGWFGDSWGPHQHLEIARMRALETGRPILRAATSGISAYIDTKGKLIAATPQFQPVVLTTSFQGATGVTPWVRLGIWPLLTVLVLGFGVAVRISIRSSKKG
jgi:apolipoprotein N-acyltransferase